MAQNDVGGRRDLFGAVTHDPDEPNFHAEWERRVFGDAVFVQTELYPAGPNLDAARWAMEQLSREQHFGPYYWRWLCGLERQLTERGWLRPGEVEARLQGTPADVRRHRTGRVRMALARRSLRLLILGSKVPTWVRGRVFPLVLGGRRMAVRRPRFKVGDPARVRSVQASGHTRQPGYVTGKRGHVVARAGAARFSDANAMGRRALPQHTYVVAFDGRELWGATGEPDSEVLVELFESYLEPV